MVSRSKDGCGALARRGLLFALIHLSAFSGAWGRNAPGSVNEVLQNDIAKIKEGMTIMRSENAMLLDALQNTLQSQAILVQKIEALFSALWIGAIGLLVAPVMYQLLDRTFTKGDDGKAPIGKLVSIIGCTIMNNVSKIRLKFFAFFLHHWKMVFNAATFVNGWLDAPPEDTHYGSKHHQENDVNDLSSAGSPPSSTAR